MDKKAIITDDTSLAYNSNIKYDVTRSMNADNRDKQETKSKQQRDAYTAQFKTSSNAIEKKNP